MKLLAMYSTDERKRRIVARGEHSGHSHVLIGGEFDKKKGILTVEREGDAVIRHLVEEAWLSRGDMVWTGEHKDIVLWNPKAAAGPQRFRITPQYEFHPQLGRAVRVRD
jgi:hypothetical protein